MSALTTDPRGRVTPAARVAAMREVAHLHGRHRAHPGATATSGRGCDATPRGWSTSRGGPRLVAAAEALERTHGADPVDSSAAGTVTGATGTWASGDGVLKVWDWERFDPEVPLGFDALHYAAQRVRPGEREAQSPGGRRSCASVPETLAELGVPSDRHDLTLRLYLLEIAVRYVDALTHGATARPHAPDRVGAVPARAAARLGTASRP